MSGNKSRFDREERTACFGESIIDFAKTILVNLVSTPLISQIVRSGTSVGANYFDCLTYRRVGQARFEHRPTRYFQRAFWWAGARSELVPPYIVASQTVELRRSRQCEFQKRLHSPYPNLPTRIHGIKTLAADDCPR